MFTLSSEHVINVPNPAGAPIIKFRNDSKRTYIPTMYKHFGYNNILLLFITPQTAVDIFISKRVSIIGRTSVPCTVSIFLVYFRCLHSRYILSFRWCCVINKHLIFCSCWRCNVHIIMIVYVYIFQINTKNVPTTSFFIVIIIRKKKKKTLLIK